jgi:hypothetical protein
MSAGKDPSNNDVLVLKTNIYLMSTLMTRLRILRSNKASRKEARIQKEKALEARCKVKITRGK